MTPTAANVLLALLALYLGVGVLCALGFVSRGVSRIDPDARGATWGFRIAILPGVAALWPWIVRRRAVGDDPQPRERTPHRDAARARAAEEAP